MTRLAIFVDGAYLEHLAQFRAIDFGALKERLANGAEVLRCYYFDALPYLPFDAHRSETTKYNRKHRLITAIRYLPRFEVRLGRVKLCGDDGKRQQKQVDCYLTAECVRLASKGYISDAVVLAGDEDFVPPVRIMKEEGVVVHLFHGAGVADELLAEADEHTLITTDFIDSILRHQRLAAANETRLALERGMAEMRK